MKRRSFVCSMIFTVTLVAATIAGSPVSADDDGGVLVIGSTGRMGSRFIAQLPETAGPVTAFVRPTSNRDRLKGQDVTYSVGDVWDRQSVMDAVRTARPRVILITVQSRFGERPMPYVGAVQNIVAAARDTDVRQIFFIGQVGSSKDGVVQGYRAINYPLFNEELIELGRAEKILIESGLPYTIIRVGAIISDGVRGVHPATGQGRLVEDQGTFGPVAYDDLAGLAVGCVDQPQCLNKIFHTTDDTLGVELERWVCRRFADSPDEECG